MDKVRDIEQRVQSLSSVLASPVGEGDCAEKGRRAELKRFVLGTCTNIKRFAYPSLRKLDGILAAAGVRFHISSTPIHPRSRAS